jgi:glycosyl transferase family 1
VLKKKPKALYIGLNVRYLNDTISLWVTVLGRTFDLYCYGPGFVSPETLQHGVDKYVDSVGGVDFIFASLMVCYKSDPDRLNNYFRQATASLGTEVHVKPYFLEDTSRFLKSNRRIVVSFLLEIDPHVAPQSVIDQCFEHANYFLLWGDGFLNSKGDAAALANEQYIQKKLRKQHKLGSLDDFALAQRSQVINLGHLVADTEFYWSKLETRKYDVSVPGSRYYRRDRIFAELNGLTKTLRIHKFRYSWIFKSAARMGLKPYANFYTIHLYNLAFQRALSQTKVCVTDGGANNYPVRKFFEISAAGALLVCWPAEGLDLMGFKHGQNCFFVRDDDEVVDLVQRICRNPGEFENVAAWGRELVLRSHSTTARVAQLSEAISKIQAGSFNGSTWREGRFICLPGESEGTRHSQAVSSIK